MSINKTSILETGLIERLFDELTGSCFVWSFAGHSLLTAVQKALTL